MRRSSAAKTGQPQTIKPAQASRMSKGVFWFCIGTAIFLLLLGPGTLLIPNPEPENPDAPAITAVVISVITGLAALGIIGAAFAGRSQDKQLAAHDVPGTGIIQEIQLVSRGDGVDNVMKLSILISPQHPGAFEPFHAEAEKDRDNSLQIGHQLAAVVDPRGKHWLYAIK
ncbi:hypothetical protein RSal33209_2573 [Renibacterium salmoninarum ATCC 33209]|uniref:Uncharacterized protein n=1 Tax=Renibacterium salmoninarum (strain ATCC 33209 / DSM 20767 / JCM 11484 / NBRC 15589 / NCIMB 2235) TaxID=288705 RepID=A9WRL6_RENSM|nr:hypothetical protein [Renibacterium salmoninarum]ABY24298.1 hypothetical protein RSal33209_2573 [Renibacterium salmoninarum ATCC 33209]